MYDLQLRDGGYYSAQAAALHELAGANIPKRGSIYITDKDGGRVSVAINREYPKVFAVPSEIQNPREVAVILSKISGRGEDELYDILSKENDPYETIIKRATDEQILKLNEQSITGVYIGEESARYYPLGRIATHIIGFSSIDESNMLTGRYGIEAGEDSILKGERGSIDGDRLIRPKDGGDVYLTIDRNIQVQAETILEELISKYGAQGGTVIVENPKTGEILAMASAPDFDPNDYGSFGIETFLNPAVQAIYEPGSIFKVITMAAGIDSGKITPDTVFTDTGSLTLNGRTIRNWDLKAHGTVTMTNVIEKSLNTGAAFAERTMGHDVFYGYLDEFGFRGKRGIDLPGEISGSLKPLESDARDINFATASFGQGISVTPIGLISSMSAIANGGVMMRPYVNKATGEKVAGRVISEDTSKKVAGMMVSAVDKAEIARISGYSVAGKTGTAQVPNFKTGGYTDEVINTYVGFAPAYDPKFVILVKLNKPAGAPLAGMTVVPAFRDLAQFIINYYNVPPDRPNR